MTIIKKLLICTHKRHAQNMPSCAGRGSLQLLPELEKICKSKNIELKQIACFGQCEKGVNIRFAPGGKFFHFVTEENLPKILEKLNDLQ